jgi:hypothetical protein
VEGEFKQDTAGVCTVADAVTGATITEFGGYSGILYKAYKKQGIRLWKNKGPEQYFK